MGSAAWRCGAFGVPLIAAAPTNARAETIELPTFRRRRDDSARRRPDRCIESSRRGLAEESATF